MISVIIPTYNSSKTVNKTIRSVLNQSFKRYELIIIDDGSTDNTVSKIKDFNDSRIKLIKIQRTGGPAKPRNIGILIQLVHLIKNMSNTSFNLKFFI